MKQNFKYPIILLISAMLLWQMFLLYNIIHSVSLLWFTNMELAEANKMNPAVSFCIQDKSPYFKIIENEIEWIK